MTFPSDKRGLAAKLWMWLAILALLSVTALLLRLQGRLWICACGDVWIWIDDICSSDNSQHFLDPYAFTHVLHGFLLYWLIDLLAPRLKEDWQLLIAIAAEAAWEVFENTNFIIERYREATAALGYTGDTVVNSFGDILCCIIGFVIARRLGFFRSMLAFGALELVLIFWIKDSMVLQILMLTYPIEAIKAWQLCA